MTSIDLIKKALELTEERITIAPGFSILVSIKNQLQYLHDLIEEKTKDHTMLSKIILGHYAAHEFEDTDPIYASVLMQCQNEAKNLQNTNNIKKIKKI